MIKNSMSLKAKINNIAKNEKVSPQAVMQTYMLERLLERISKSKYKDNFILKGGMLISSIVGIDSRSTMDMDTTIKGFNLDRNTLDKILNEIINIDIDDNTKFSIIGIENIRNDDNYGGLRVHLQAYFNEMPVDLKIDVTTGDKITYGEINYKYNLLLEKRSIEIWTYNVETIIAEKYESIIKRSIFNTRIRDFYDLYMLTHLQNKTNISKKMLVDAITETSKHRNTYDIINDKNVVDEVINSIDNDKALQNQWSNYQNTYAYAKDIEYTQLIDSIKSIKKLYFK